MTAYVYNDPPRRAHRCDDCWCVTLFTGERSVTTRHATKKLAVDQADRLMGVKS